MVGTLGRGSEKNIKKPELTFAPMQVLFGLTEFGYRAGMEEMLDWSI